MGERRRVLDVGNCSADHGAIRAMLQSHFDTEVDQATDLQGALESLKQRSYDLVLVNRRFFADGSDGGELIRRMRESSEAEPPVMMISNFQEAQEVAVSHGAVQGFGKRELTEPATVKLLGRYLGRTGD